MKQYGKVLAYDGYVGNIIDDKGTKYIFSSKDIKDKTIIEGDFVTFIVEVFETIEIKEYTARFITKVKEEEKSTNK